MAEKVAFLGLGVMGYPMAGHLARAGHDVTVFNRGSKRATQWVAEHAGQRADSPADAAAGARFVFCCVGADPDVREVSLGDRGAFRSLDAGAVQAHVARHLARFKVPEMVEFTDTPLPRNPAGKLLKNQIREAAADGEARG